MCRLAALLLPWVVVLAFACRSKPPRVLDAQQEGELAPSLASTPFEYRIGAGDVLRVNVFGHPDLSSQLYEGGVPGTPVEGSGQIMCPLIGAVPAAGLTAIEVSDEVEQRLARYLRDPHVDVVVVRFGAHRVFVLGEVSEPGSFVLERPTSAMEALAMAGGFGTYAYRRQVAWVRGPLIEDNLVLFDGGAIDPVAAQSVQSGDVIFVGRRRWSDQAEAARELLPFLAFITQPLSIAIQAATLRKID